MPIGTDKIREETKESLERIQKFDTNLLPRENELGQAFNFNEVVPHAKVLIELWNRLSPIAVEDFPDQKLTIIRDTANNDYNLSKQVLDFNVEEEDAKNRRRSLINNIQNTYQNSFENIYQFISYSLHRSADFQRLDQDARATLQTIQDKTKKFASQMENHEVEARRVLDEIRKVAAEEGVTQQAAHFRTASEHHENEAKLWHSHTVKLAWALGIFAALSLFINKIPFIAPTTIYESFQLGLSKVLIFSVITYMLFLSARNFLNHKHNGIVNKHRQNALMTHKALVEAAADIGIREAIMVQAASCIFSPQATGYTFQKGDGEVSTPKSVVEILSKPISNVAKQSNQ
uniref:Uncharacterized protein n=1 Tax=Candidatus Kentrum sp. TUN TaxID=2126343 RepID=A0A450ZCG6_9GAMM|nr:MAG: hypothetical protein BECKTUN1418D_GA0071000_100819 [Candidatus Kentron sp. TUN]